MKLPQTSSSISPGQRGFIIVPVLWILMMLASFAGVISVYLSNSATALSLNDDRLKSSAMLSAGLELTTYRLLSFTLQNRPSSGSFHFRLDDGAVSVGYSSESGRINLNQAPKELLANFFQTLGAQPKDAGVYADRVIGWRTAPSDDALDSESSFYRTAGSRYLPRSGAFPSVQELWLVLGLPQALVERALPHVTVYGANPAINVFAASPAVIAAIPGMTPATLAMFLKERDALPRDGNSINQYFGSSTGFASFQGSNIVRVRLDILFNSGRRSGAQAVIVLQSGNEPYRVLSWQDDADSFAGTETIGERSL